MTRVDFYHLRKWPLERVLPTLLEKVQHAGCRAVLLAGSLARVETLTVLLWTYTTDSWLPHGDAADGYAILQPLWLTAVDENPNRANVLILTDSMDSSHKAEYLRCLDLFDGNNPEEVSRARNRWRACRDASFTLFYWQQTEHGNWQRRV